MDLSGQAGIFKNLMRFRWRRCVPGFPGAALAFSLMSGPCFYKEIMGVSPVGAGAVWFIGPAGLFYSASLLAAAIGVTGFSSPKECRSPKAL